MRIQTGFPALLTLLPAMASAGQTITVDMLPIEDWTEVSFKDNTTYQAVNEKGAPPSLKAISQSSASALAKRIKVNLEKTPYLNWRWKIDQVLDKPDEQSKAGDDYPARIYVVKEGGWAPWRTRSMNYVWSSSQPVSSVWASAYTGQSMMVAIKSGDQQAGQWQMEKRNVRQDFKNFFGEEINTIDVVAIMTDTDNTESMATAWYADIFFSAE
ncbi:MAG: DUF3047 domain-containing protein [Candidatus Thiodiazotropha lotti]|uniref:DUF3047 domain-containing protein n=1 Tax=Candidatus Thiodiazotropha lotti TaxID=2792787 RepID=A0A9E4K1V4_9GAMM|nr:DUF3047 domain-containing protein [Candidatus Thiodiazotropha lotti]MCG7929015.1 DUF3047 domain-containing protein [Candidatus Thiodiazotropha lotti]MCG7937438.1 DUF3047 domain-containing protein [Candidatus Thiodiazotropha lotti]MCG7986265.1 DUF3047 domain-containing protein [Candidatus Thiodiazotropha lotti]MCG8004011.1 DUF3047 domain-containing protein [Candidatus Thiodiazotropha lotti]